MKNKKNGLNKILVLLALLIFVAGMGCKKQSNDRNLSSYLSLQLPEQTYDYTVNVQSNSKHLLLFQAAKTINSNKATLGRVIFYDKMLSLNNAVACASCHKQEMAFADGEKFSRGFANELTKRNSMAITNPIIAQRNHSGFFWDVRERDLGMMVIKPVQNHIEMGFDTIANVIRKMNNVPYYSSLFIKAYASEEITVDKIRESLSEFLLSMVTIKSPYDLAAENNFATFTPEEFRGWQIFSKEARCINCHGGDLNNGWSETIANIGLDLVYTDKGIVKDLINFNSLPGEGNFKVPSLRNVELTGPYMHDGRFNTLEEVVEHYNSGVKNHPALHWNLRINKPDGTNEPRRLNLNQADKNSLVAFLKTLTDRSFTTDPKFSNPFVAKALN